LDTVTQTNQGQIAYSYNPTTLQLASELVNYDLDHNGTYEFSHTLDRSQDALLRDSGYVLKNGSTPETSAAYSYSATDGRLAQVSNPLIPNQLFTYSYLANSNLLATVTGPVHTVTNTWEPNRDVLATKQNKAGSNVISQYNYAVNAIGQRSGVTTSGSAFPAASSGAWGYDLLGQVITSDRAFQYDAQSRRIAKIAGTTTTSAAVIYLYDAWNSIAEYTRSAGPTPTFTLQKTRLWGADLSGSMQGAGGVGGLLSESNISNPQSPISYPLYDGNGNVSEYLTTTGSVAAHYEYDPFGNTVVNTDTSNQFTYKFSTKPADSETGLYYYGYRYYDPMTGRWPSRDPIGEKGGLNLYTLAKNNGPNEVDVLGLFYEPPIPIEPPPPKVFKTFSLVSGIIIAADFIVDKAIADMSDCKIGTCPTIQERTAFGDCCVDHFHVAIAAAATSFSAASIACGAYGPWGATICLSAIQFENKKSIDKINSALDTCIARCTK
jgi:RHS repeat-associated protein